jgi:error-prone DNA polymerase
LWLGPESDDERSGGRDDHAQTELALEDPYAGLAFPDLGATDRMVAEYRMLHFSAALHPLSLLKGQLPSGTVESGRLHDLPQHASVRVAGLVTARQRPGTAKGYVFVLMEDEAGVINVIVKPEIYERDKNAVRLEPFLAVSGRLQKDGASLNVIAEEVTPLRVPGAPVRRSGMAKNQGAPRENRTIAAGPAAVRERGPQDAGDLHASLPGTLEYWTDPGHTGPTPFRYLTALRQSPPGIKSFG